MFRSRQNKKSLKLQISEKLQDMLKIGASKNQDKHNGIANKYIYSWTTYHTYMQQCCDFAKWCKEAPIRSELGRKPRTIEECKPYINDYINDSIERGLSPYTIKLKAAALAKLYGCSSEKFDIKTPSRRRKNILRSRNTVIRDKHFSTKNNADLITFCKCTGLRRAELQQIRGSDLIYKDGKPYLSITRATKGGRPRVSPVTGEEYEINKTIELLTSAGKDKVFPSIPSHADIHSYRSEYANRIYDLYKRQAEEYKNERLIIYKNRVVDVYNSNGRFPDYQKYAHLYDTSKDKRTGKRKMLDGYRDVSSVYCCREELAGVCYDRRALFEVSKALGHNRESVVAEHYLR